MFSKLTNKIARVPIKIGGAETMKIDLFFISKLAEFAKRTVTFVFIDFVGGVNRDSIGIDGVKSPNLSRFLN